MHIFVTAFVTFIMHISITPSIIVFRTLKQGEVFPNLAVVEAYPSVEVVRRLYPVPVSDHPSKEGHYLSCLQ